MWHENPQVSIVIPVFNEEDNLYPLYQNLEFELNSIGKTWEIVFVDDGSKDKSADVLRTISCRDGRVKVIRLKRNFGQTAAMSAGFDYSKGSIIVTMDGDLQNDPSDIPRMIDKLEEGYDVVSGWRKDRKDPFLSKRLPSILSNKLASWLTGLQIHDNGCTLKAYRREIISEINLYGEQHRFIPAMAFALGADITEIEVIHHPRVNGESKYGITRVVRGFLDLIALKFLISYMTRPMQIFGGLGLLAIFSGALFGVATVFMKLLLGMDLRPIVS